MTPKTSSEERVALQPKIDDEQFQTLERNILYAVKYQFAQITGSEMSMSAQEKVAEFFNDLISDETEEA